MANIAFGLRAIFPNFLGPAAALGGASARTAQADDASLTVEQARANTRFSDDQPVV